MAADLDNMKEDEELVDQLNELDQLEKKDIEEKLRKGQEENKKVEENEKANNESEPQGFGLGFISVGLALVVAAGAIAYRAYTKK